MAPHEGGAGEVETKANSVATTTTLLSPPQLFDLLPNGDDVVVRRLWWRWRRHHGVALPAERGVILIDGWR